MKSLSLNRIVGKRADKHNDYLQVKPEHPDNIGKLPRFTPSTKTSQNIKKGKWHY
jgi:hypothetical protein